jgi:hypothetical protein
MLGEVRVMVLNTTFNNISVMSWQSVLLVDKLDHMMLYPVHLEPVWNSPPFVKSQKWE